MTPGILHAAAAGVRESASCIVIQKIREAGLCKHGLFDYRLLFVKRHQKMKSWPGALTFPGGVIDKSDQTSDFSQLKCINKAKDQSVLSEIEVVYRKTAIRELVEETGIDLNIDYRNLVPWSIWQTPLIYERRFNTVFYLMFMESSEDLNLRPQEGEIHSVHWLSPAEIFHDQNSKLAPPTVSDISKFYVHKTFQKLQSFANYRYQNYNTTQWMPVIVYFKDCFAAILSSDSYYNEALEIQLKDVTQKVLVSSTVAEHNKSQDVLCRILVTGDGRREFVGFSSNLEGHTFPNNEVLMSNNTQRQEK